MNKLYTLIGIFALVLVLGAGCDPQPVPVETPDTDSTPVVEEQAETPTQQTTPDPEPADEAPEGLMDAIDNYENQDPDQKVHRMMYIRCQDNDQCLTGRVCVDGDCVPAEDVLLPDERPEFSPCMNDAQCIEGKVCYQGGCVPIPEICNYHPECYSDAYICIDNECVGPGLHEKTCTFVGAERWFCPIEYDCGDDIGECWVAM